MPSFDLSRSPLLTTVHDVLGELRDAAWDERDKGDRFERLIASYLRTDPLYAQKYDEVWRWSDWLGREARPDTGIDLVARERETGELCAIQCKFYDASRTLEKGEIDSFFSLDDALAQILQEIELRAGFAEDARLEAERARIEHERQWEAAMEHAKVKLVESHRDDIFLQQAENWRQTKLLRDYVAAMTSAVADLEDVDERAAVKAWIDWCAESAEQNDPLAGPLRMPDDPEAKPDTLKPFLQGWSPYGPEAGRNGW